MIYKGHSIVIEFPETPFKTSVNFSSISFGQPVSELSMSSHLQNRWCLRELTPPPHTYTLHTFHPATLSSDNRLSAGVVQTHFSPSLLPETHWEWADGQRWEWRGRVERLLCRSVQLQRTRTHLCPLVEGSRESRQLWTAPPHWVPACLQRSPPLPSHLVVHQQLECQDQPPGWFPLQTPHWPSYHGDSSEEGVA